MIESEWVAESLPDHWGCREGGKKCVLSKRRAGTLEKNLSLLKKMSSERMKDWHKRMKKEDPFVYHQIQYARFKKIASYSCKTDRGELVRNRLEKEIADRLNAMGVDYSYEPCLRAHGSMYFPDFLFGKTILEVTEWKGYQKARSLRTKAWDYLAEGFRVLIVVPRSLWGYYAPVRKWLITPQAFEKLNPNDLYRV